MNILIFNIFRIKWPKSEEKINFGGRWVWLSESSPTQNFVVTAWPWPHLCRPAAAASDDNFQAWIQGVGARAGAHPWDGVSPFKTH